MHAVLFSAVSPRPWVRAFRRLFAVGAVVAVALLATTGTASAAETVTLGFESQFGWPVYSTNGTLLGPAQEVCLNTTLPGPRCPTGGMSYGYPFGGWPADLSSIGKARWIWAPGVRGGTSPADLQSFAFSKTFNLPGAPAGGAISIAADDFAEVLVNGVSVGTIGSVTDISLAGSAQSVLTTFDLSPYLISGKNTITVVAANGPAEFAGCPAVCSYGENPAGVVFEGSLSAVLPD